MLWIYFIHLFAFILLMEGLFPYTKREEIRLNQTCFDHLKNSSDETNSRLILMIIDALRSDYVFNRNNSFHLKSIVKLEQSNLSLKYQLKCHSPTVTLPRLKSILTGSIPSFWDLIYNYNTSEIDLDNILSRYKETNREKKILFYGDETWTKLYPKEIFARFESLQSFFVKDFHQIDSNVTKNLRRELNNETDWHLLIVHYLGLDHIGHALGAFHHNVLTKLDEYDRIIDEITSKLTPNDLLLITGDHGMIDQGGHGGSSTREILVPLVVVSRRFQHKSTFEDENDDEEKEFYQIDLTSTISSLLKIGIPSNNLGIQIESILHKYFYRENQKFFQCLKDDNQRQLASILSSSSSSSSFPSSMESMRSKAIQSSQTANWIYVALSTILFILSSLDYFLLDENLRRSIDSKHLWIFSMLFFIEEILIENLRISFSLILIEFYLYRFSVGKFVEMKFVSRRWTRLSDLFDEVYRYLYLLSLLSSSYIEEEHQLWFYFLSTMFLIRSFEEKSFRFVGELFLLRSIRQWNQTGNKDLNQADVKMFLQNVDHRFYLDLMDFISTLLFIVEIRKRCSSRVLSLCPLMIFLIRSDWIFSSSISVRLIQLLFVYYLIEFIRRENHRSTIGFLYLLLIHRRHQSFLLFVYYLFYQLKSSSRDDKFLFLFSQSAFFHLGNSNSFVTIDVSTGFVGLNDYFPLIHGLFIYFSIYLLTIIYQMNLSMKSLEKLQRHVLLSNFICLCCILIHRNHLFLWTVFAPKLFYQFAQTSSFIIVLALSTFYRR